MFGIANNTNNAVTLLNEIGLSEAQLSENLRTLANVDARYLRDLKINVTNALNAETLSRKEAYLIALAVAANEKNLD